MRFSGFTDEWKKSNLGNISSNEMYGMNSAAKDYDGFNKYIRITDISETSNKFIPNPLTSPDGYLEDKYKLKKGDIVFARTGASTGKTYLYDDNDRNLYFAGFLIKFHIDNANPKFIFYNTLKEEYLNWVSIMSVRSGQPGINSNEYKKLPIILPSLDEQNEISNFLTSIDKKIDLLERKHQFYQEFKKYLMQQIFTQKLRFIEETWSSEKLGNLCKITMGQSPSSKNYSKNSNDTILIQGNADLISGKIVPRIYTSEITKLSYPGDIILTVRAPVGDLAINEFDSCIGRGVCSIKGNKFIYYYLESLKDKHVWERLSQGSTFESVNSNDIKNLNLKIPSNSTQNHIINFFTAIDTKIELLQKKHGEYIRFKQYLMQNIFADKSAEKLRFNFTDDWKQYKLKDVLTVKSSSISINQLEENTGDYPLYGASGFLKNIDFCEMDVDYISIVKDGSGVGNLSFHEKNSSIVNTSQYLLPKKNFNINFLYYLLQTINLMKYVNGSSIPHIYFKDYCIEKINIPSLDEQEKIGKLFVDVDITMENLNKNINATQEFKKGLLQQMFV